MCFQKNLFPIQLHTLEIGMTATYLKKSHNSIFKNVLL